MRIKSEVIATISRFTEGDFTGIRTEESNNDRLFADETSEYRAEEPEPPIAEFKKRLIESYLPFFTKQFRRYLRANPDFFVTDGSSALPFAYVFKAAFKQFAALHPADVVKPPEFLLVDIHPLRALCNYSSGIMDKHEFRAFTRDLAQVDRLEIWGEQGLDSLNQSLDRINQKPEPTLIIYDEFSDPLCWPPT